MRVNRYVAFSFISAAALWYGPLPALAATYITEDIATNTEWTLEGSPYVINFLDSDPYSPHLLTIHSGATLTVDPGVVVKFGVYNGMAVSGVLDAKGTEHSQITFTSLKDDSVAGDTNGDDFGTLPTDEQWMHLEFNAGSEGIFDYAVVRYGGASRLSVPTTGIENLGGMLTIDRTTFSHNGYDGLSQYDGHTVLTNSVISNHIVGISMNGGVLEIRTSRIHNNSEVGIKHRDGELLITQSEIDSNGVGISAEYVGSIEIHNSSIHDNATIVEDESFGIRNQTEIIAYDEHDVPFVSEPGISIDATNNWWGHASGPYDSIGNSTGTSNAVFGAVTYSPWLTSNPFIVADPCVALGTCVSNVLFLPGIEASRLYEGSGCGKPAEEKLWEPIGESLFRILRGAGDDKVRDLFLDENGKSLCSDIYVKTNDVIDSVKGNNIYQSFIDEMSVLKEGGIINDWKPVAYDWRLSLTDLLNNGTERAGKIFYGEATSTPYIEQTLRALAKNSMTGKVSIVAHSNGGLVTKALLNKLGNAEASGLVDKIIFVGVPQSGTPLAVGALLYGLDQGISSHGIPILHSEVARELAQNSPMAYHLLPSESYFGSIISDTEHPVARFAGDAYEREISAYGTHIASSIELSNFLLASTTLNTSLIDYANSQHAALDAWVPPEGIEVSQITGWGVDTVAGIDFYTLPAVSALSSYKPVSAYRPIFTEDGDGTVTVPSALMIASSTNVKRYWLNLDSYRIATSIKRTHGDIFEIPTLGDFLKNVIRNNIVPLPAYISSSQPPSITDEKKLIFFLHSPLTLQLTDSSGNVTGLRADGSLTQDISNSNYGEFGEVKYIIVPQGNAYQLTMHGQGTGTFSLDIQESSGGLVTSSATIANVPTTANTFASLTIADGLETASPLLVDEHGDGNSEISLTPVAGETVSYKPLTPAPAPQVQSGGGGGRRLAPLVVIPSATVATSSATTETLKSVTASKDLKSKKSPARIVKVANVPAKNMITPSQTASVLNASQHPVLTKLGRAVYNGLYGVWEVLTNIF